MLLQQRLWFTFALLNCLFSMPRQFNRISEEVFSVGRRSRSLPGVIRGLLGSRGPLERHLKEVSRVTVCRSHLLEDGGVVGAEELAAFRCLFRRRERKTRWRRRERVRGSGHEIPQQSGLGDSIQPIPNDNQFKYLYLWRLI